MKTKLLFCISALLSLAQISIAQNTWTATHSYQYDPSTSTLTNIATQINYVSGGTSGYIWTVYLKNASTQTEYTVGKIPEGGVSSAGTLDQNAAYANLNSIQGLPNGNYILMANATIVTGDLALNDASDYIVYSGNSGIEMQSASLNNSISVYPNPVKNISNLSFYLSASSTVSLKIFSENGKLVSNPVQEKLAPGNHLIPFDMSDTKPGMYFYQFTSNDHVTNGILVKE